MARGDVYVQPDAPDPVLPPSIVLDIVSRHTQRADALLEVDESGGEARAYLLSGNLVVKTQRPHRLRPRTSLAKEAAVLRLLRGPLGNRVPDVLGYGHTDTSCGVVEYLVMTRMVGRPVIRNPQSSASRPRLFAQLGEILATLHATAVDSIGASLLPSDEEHEDLVRRLESGFADLVEAFTERPWHWPLRESPERVAVDALSGLTGEVTPVLLHSNPGPSHVFCSSSGTLTGLIDFGDSYRSHPALDLHRWPDPADRLALRAGYVAATTPPADFDATWRAAMILADMAALISSPEHAVDAGADLKTRLST